MLALALSVGVLLALLNLGQWHAARVRSRRLAALHRKLSAVLAAGGDEQLLVFDAEPELQPLLVALNRALDTSRRTRAAHLQSEAALRQLLANMAHDLKTPLTVVRGLTETLAADPDLDAAERARLATVVHRKTLETLALMSRFFELARLEAGDAALPLAPVDVAELARSSILFFYETIAAQGLEVALDMPDTPVYAVANADALSRALHNLIANALRYGADGGSIGLAVRSSATHVSVEVTDRGRGIPERHQAQIFDRRYTADAARSAASGGSGLGLAITRRLVELMGGRITLRSTPGSATVFTIELARAAPADRIA